MKDMGSDQAYITLLGRSSWALLNCYYAVLRQTSFRPSEILVITEELFTPKLGSTIRGLRILSEEYQIAPRIEDLVLAEADFHAACIRIPETIVQRKKQGMAVALDITSGRKALIVGALIGVPKESLDHVFYLAISRTEGAARPYMMIPLQIQKLRDFKMAIDRCSGVSA